MFRELVDIGILGSGQLARMLAEAAIKHGFRVGVLSNHQDDPARLRGVSVFSELSDLCQRSKKIIFESEFVDVVGLRKFETSKFFPSLSAIELLQNKLAQKKLLKKLEIPSADFFEVEEIYQASNFEKAVFKMARWGYDGKGNFFFIKGHNEQGLKSFLQQAKNRKIQVFVENCIEFQQELAITGCCLDKKFSFFPLVQSVQEKGICKWVRGPAEKIDPELRLEEEAKEIFKKIAIDLNYEGVLSIEFFVDENRRLLVNELAPRVHNSAHYSLLAASFSQFDVQVMAATNRRLLEPKIQAPFFGMFNLLSPVEKANFEEPNSDETNVSNDFQLYWYGKKRLSLGRKMGHICYQADHREDLDQIEGRILRWEKDFWANRIQS